MKIKKSNLVALLVAIGFAKAPTFNEDKLVSMAEKVPDKVAKEDLDEEFHELYDKLADEEDDSPIEFEEEEGGEPGEESAGETPAKKKNKPGKKKPAKEKAEKPEKDDKPAKKKAAATPASKKDIPRDAFGCREGTISAKVNSVVSNEWQSEEEIAEAAGVTLDQARGRLYYAATEGQMEYRKRIEYRLVGKPVSKKAAKKAAKS